MLDDFKHAFRRHNNAHVQLILVNVFVFLALLVIMIPLVLSKNESIFYELLHKILSVPAYFPVFLEQPWTILTYAFVHSMENPWHIIGNMIFLYWFGRIFVEYLGSDKLIAVYVLGALAGGAAYLLSMNTIPYFESHLGGYMVGASGAISAIVVATATLLPDYTIFLLFFGPVRIKYIAAVVIVIMSLMGVTGPNAGGNIAHLGGALIGFIYIKQLQAGSNWGKWVTLTIDWFKSLFKPKQRVKVSYRNDEAESYRRNTQSNPSKISQAEIDTILDKISAGGYESLSKDEKDKLFKASKKQ